jgi:hypothetical protein
MLVCRSFCKSSLISNNPRKTLLNVTENLQEISGKASDQMKEVVEAAYYQRIDSLLVGVGHQQWGSFDPQSNVVQLHELLIGWRRRLIGCKQQFIPLEGQNCLCCRT